MLDCLIACLKVRLSENPKIQIIIAKVRKKDVLFVSVGVIMFLVAHGLLKFGKSCGLTSVGFLNISSKRFM